MPANLSDIYNESVMSLASKAGRGLVKIAPDVIGWEVLSRAVSAIADKLQGHHELTDEELNKAVQE